MNNCKYVLDSSALLAVINEEPGAANVRPMLGSSVISAVNLAEVIGKFTREGAPAEETRQFLVNMVQAVVPFDEPLALRTGRLAPLTKPYGLSLGDRACLATAEHLKMEAVTSDKAWRNVKNSCKITVIR